MKQTIDSSLRNESLEWWNTFHPSKQFEICKRHFPTLAVTYVMNDAFKIDEMYLKETRLKDVEEIAEASSKHIYQQETNPKAIIGSGVEEKPFCLSDNDYKVIVSSLIKSQYQNRKNAEIFNECNEIGEADNQIKEADEIGNLLTKLVNQKQSNGKI